MVDVINQSIITMNNQQQPNDAKPMSTTEMLVDIRKRLGRIERDLIAVLQEKAKKPFEKK